jgi:hypothetical protein
MQDTVRVRYAIDYKLDKKTTAKAEDLLREFFNAIGERRGIEATSMHAIVRAAILIASKCQVQ